MKQKIDGKLRQKALEYTFRKNQESKQSLELWINAFIPNHLYYSSGSELTFQSKVFTSLASQEKLSLIPFLSFFPYIFASYGTDQRSFSSNKEDTARMKVKVIIPDILESSISDIEVSRYCFPSVQITNRWQGFTANHHQKLETLTVKPTGNTKIERDNNSIHIQLTCHAANPFFNYRGFDIAPSIQIAFDIFINLLNKNSIQIYLNGCTTQFPAFEAYAQLKGREPVILYQKLPHPGKTPFNLFNGPTETVAASALIKTGFDTVYTSNNRQPFFNKLSERPQLSMSQTAASASISSKL